MRTNSTLAASLVAAGLVFTAVAPFTVVQAAEVTEAQLAAARTPADHEAIAAAYDAEAKAAEDMASNHAAMAAAYKSSGMKGGSQSMVTHCNALAKNYKAAAQEYRALATQHRAMGQTAGK